MLANPSQKETGICHNYLSQRAYRENTAINYGGGLDTLKVLQVLSDSSALRVLCKLECFLGVSGVWRECMLSGWRLTSFSLSTLLSRSSGLPGVRWKGGKGHWYRPGTKCPCLVQIKIEPPNMDTFV